MIAELAVDWTECTRLPSDPSASADLIASPGFVAEEIDPVARLTALLDQEIDRRDLQLDEPFTFVVSSQSSVPLALCGTKSIQLCDQSHAGRCRRACDARSREWRAELDAASSGPDGGERYELVYRVRWTSDWYRDDLALPTPPASLR